MSKKIIAIVGITGNQGASVADVFLSEPDWHIRGISRDPSKPSAQIWASKGVEMVAGDLDDVESMKKAFKGANVIFGATDFWQHFRNPASHEEANKRGITPNEVACEREAAQGQNLADAAASVIGTLDRFILSTLSSAKTWSKGAITFNMHFDSKAEAVFYLKEKYPALDKKTSYLQLGIFTSNWKEGQVPKKLEDGSFRMEFPMSGDKKFPMVDARRDTGQFVKALLEAPAGTNLMGCGSYLSWNEWCSLWSRLLGVNATFHTCDRKVWDDMGPFGREIADMFQYINDFGYDGGDPSVVYPSNLGIDVKVTTIEEHIKGEDWSSVL
ncbi:NAD(P)-binding protein [Lojkania enalia]|uniref:NAD(P)-binding protein n=1 Tax=Lojkania enalia TaxID=147567 RepID=A0A9P4NBN8_9PLEO|nr:NAD(P)-binding protein [Didymosphaeria enalia]